MNIDFPNRPAGSPIPATVYQAAEKANAALS